jgi:hypothetical protein
VVAVASPEHADDLVRAQGASGWAAHGPADCGRTDPWELDGDARLSEPGGVRREDPLHEQAGRVFAYRPPRPRSDQGPRVPQPHPRRIREYLAALSGACGLGGCPHHHCGLPFVASDAAWSCGCGQGRCTRGDACREWLGPPLSHYLRRTVPGQPQPRSGTSPRFTQGDTIVWDE